MSPRRLQRTFAPRVLVWFALTLLVGLLSPVLQPVGVVPWCTADGQTRWLVVDASADEPAQDSRPGSGSAGIECPACLPAFPWAPSATRTLPDLSPPPASLVRPIVEARRISVTGSPLPPRGPPVPA